jgi:hypothetical protein
MSRGGRTRVGGVVVVLGLLVAPVAAHATTITVNSAVDGASSDCTLRNAITAANSNATQGSCAAGEAAPAVDVIDFNLPTPATITLGSALPDLMESVTIDGPGMNQLTIDGADSYRPFTTFGLTTISISDLTVTNGRCDETCGSVGGAIHNVGDLTLTNVALTDNTASDDGHGADPFTSAEGGAIRNINPGELTIVQSKLTGNQALAFGHTSNGNTSGGAIVNSGTVSIDRSTLDSNTSSASGGLNASSSGGAITNDGTLTITRSTVSNNTAGGTGASSSNGGYGGGVDNFNDPANVNVTIDRSTFAGNSTTSDGDNNDQGGGLDGSGGTYTVTSSTFAHNSAYSASNILAVGGTTHIKNTIVSDPGGQDNCVVSLTSDGYNLSDDAGCGFTGTGDQQGVDPMLAPALASNGGPTKTYALLPGSPAIDKGLSSAGETVDQRGMTRPWDFPDITNASGGDGTDVGAFEVQDTTPPDTIIDSGPAGNTNDPTPTFAFHSTEAGSTFQCRVDAAAFASCTSPKTVAHLNDGAHTFQVRARDAAMNLDPTPASRSFTVKTAAISRSGSTLIVTAAPGAKDNLRITQPSASAIQISDAPSGTYTGSGVHTVAGSGCTRMNDYVASCNAAGVNTVKVTSGAQTDKVTNMTAIPSTLIGGAAADVLTGGSANDTLNGGTGADSFKGMNGNDILLARDGASDALIHCEGAYVPNPADKAVLDALPNDPDSIVHGCETKLRP